MDFSLRNKLLAVTFLSFFALLSCKQSENTVVIEDAPTTSNAPEDTTTVQRSGDESFQQLTIGEINPIRSLDPLFVENASGLRAIQFIYEGLVRYDENGEIVPAVAKKWTVGSDELTYRFTLNSDIFYHDSNIFSNGRGRRLVAADVKSVFERMARTGVPDDAAQLFMDIRGFEPYFREQHQVMMASDRQLDAVSGITVPNDSTVTFSLAESDPNFLNKLAAPQAVIYPKEAVTQNGFKAVGTGPFTLSQKRSDSLYILAKFDSYRTEGAPMIDRIDIQTGADETAMLNALSRGDIQLIPQLGPRQIEMLTTAAGELSGEVTQNYRLFDSKGALIYVTYYNTGSDIPREAVVSALGKVPIDQLFPSLPQEIVRLNRPATGAASASSVKVDSLSSTSSNDPFVRSFYSTFAKQLGEQDIAFKMEATRVPNRNTALYIEQSFPLYPDYELEITDNVMIWFSVQSLAVANNDIENLVFNNFPWWIDLRKVTSKSTNSR